MTSTVTQAVLGFIVKQLHIIMLMSENICSYLSSLSALKKESLDNLFQIFLTMEDC